MKQISAVTSEDWSDAPPVLPDSLARMWSPSPVKWLAYPMVAVALVMLPVILMTVKREDLAGILVAYLNCLLIAGATVFLATRKTIESMVPLLVLPLMAMGWPLSAIYFAVSGKTDAAIDLMDRAPLPFLQDNLRLQLVELAFLVTYLPVIMFAARHKGPVLPPYIANYRRWLSFCIAIVIATFLPFLVTRALNMPNPYFAAAMLKYGQGLLFLCGVYFLLLSKKARLVLLAFVGGVLVFSSITSDRGLIAFAVVVALAGAFFLGGLTQKTKVVVMVAVAVGLPLFVLIGNTSRVVLGGKLSVDLAYQWELVKNWREIQGEVSSLENLFARTHWTGGHSILSHTPETMAFWDLNILDYGLEALQMLLPLAVYYNPHYQGNWFLQDYGLRISEETSVEVSLLGHMWLMGGYKTVLAGGVLLGIMHWVVMAMLRAVYRKSELRAMTILAVLSPLLLNCGGNDPMYHFRSLVWFWAFGWVTYHLLRIFSQADRPSEDLLLGEDWGDEERVVMARQREFTYS